MSNTVEKAALGVTRAKAEIEEEFSRVQDEVRTARESAEAKADEPARHKKEGEIRQAVEGLSVDGVVEEISRPGLEISGSQSGISEKLVEEVNRLAALRSEQEDELARLRAEIAVQKAGWEESARTAQREGKEQEEAPEKQRQSQIDDYESRLVEFVRARVQEQATRRGLKKNLERKRAQDEYEEEQRQQEQKNQEKQEALEKSWAQREAALREQEDELARLRAEIAAQKAEWEESAQIAEREGKEQEEALEKERQSEIDDYEYKKNLERKRAQDKYKEEQRQREQKNQEKQEVLEKSWAQREAALREQEDELARLRKEVAEFPTRIQRELERAAAQAAKDAKLQVEQELVLARREAEAEKRIAQLRIKTLQEAVARQNAQTADMQRQVDEAKKQMQEIAARAIEGASGAKTLAHVNEIAMEQAKHRGPQLSVEDASEGRTLVRGAPPGGARLTKASRG